MSTNKNTVTLHGIVFDTSNSHRYNEMSDDVYDRVLLVRTASNTWIAYGRHLVAHGSSPSAALKALATVEVEWANRMLAKFEAIAKKET
jgi:hypothetical protein